MLDPVLKKSVTTIVNGKGVIICLFHGRAPAMVVNPRPPVVQMFDALVSSEVLESCDIAVPKEVFHVEDQYLDVIYTRLIQICINQASERGKFQRKSELVVSAEETQEKTQLSGGPASSPEKVLGLLKQLSTCFAPAALNAEAISITTGIPSSDLAGLLEHLTQSGAIVVTDDGYTLSDQQPFSPWIERDTAQLALGIDGKVLRVMVGGPGDVSAEVDLVRQTLDAWNIRNSEAEGIVLLFRHWKSNTYPAMNGRAQATINTQMVDRADILIALFSHRLGTQTGDFASGSVEEIERFRTSGRPVLLYFGQKEVSPAVFADEGFRKQFDDLQAYKSKIEQENTGYYGSFDSGTEIMRLVDNHVTLLTRDLKQDEYEVAGSGVGARRTLTKYRSSQVQIFRRTIEELGSEWNGESNHVNRKMGQGQLTLARLSAAFGAHRGTLMDDLSAQAKAAMDDVVTSAKSLQRMPVEFDNDSFWSRGNNLMESAKSWVDRLAETLRT